MSLCIFVFYDSEVSQSTFIFYGEGGINIHLYFIERGILLYFCILVSLEHSNVHLYSIDNGFVPYTHWRIQGGGGELEKI